MQDEDFIYDCKAAYHVVLDDIEDMITSRDKLTEGNKCFFFYSHARTSTKLCDISHGADVPLPVHVVLKLILIQAMQMLLWLV